MKRSSGNASGSAVARPEERKFLGFSISNDGSERRIAPKALDKFRSAGSAETGTDRARASRLTPEKRKDTARKTAISRWQKRRIREASIRLISKQAKVLQNELV